MVSFFFLVQAVSQGGCGWLVDDAQDFQPGDLAGVLGRLALAVVEVSRDGDHRLVDRLTQVGFGVRFQLGQDHGRNLLRAVFFPRQRDATRASPAGPLDHLVRNHFALGFDFIVAAAHKALDRINTYFQD
jgi:hypothetical protein